MLNHSLCNRIHFAVNETAIRQAKQFNALDALQVESDHRSNKEYIGVIPVCVDVCVPRESVILVIVIILQFAGVSIRQETSSEVT